MRMIQNFFKDYFEAKEWLHHHSIVWWLAALSAFVVIGSSMFGLGYNGTYAGYESGPDMSISNNASIKYVNNGDTVVFLYFYQNEDYPAKTASNISVTASIPDGMSFVSANPAPDVQGSNLEWYNLADDYGIITVEMQINDVNASLWNTAWVSADGEDPYMNNNSAAVNLTSQADSVSTDATDLAVWNTTTVSTISAGQSIQYTLSYSNVGDKTAKDAILIDTLPEWVSYLTADPAPSNIDGHSLSWNLGDLDPNDNGTITLRWTVSTLLNDGFNILNFASIDSNNADSDASNNIAAVSNEVLNNGADLYVNTTAVSNKITANQNLWFDIMLGNRWPNTASNISTSFTLPAGMTIVSASPTYTSVSGKKYSWNLSSLSLGGMSTISLVLRSSANGVYDLVANATSDTPEISDSDNSSLFGLTVGTTTPSNNNSSAGAGWGGGGGGWGWADSSSSLGDVIQAVKSELTTDHAAVTVTPGNAKEAWQAFKPSDATVQSVANKVDVAKYPTEMIEAFLFAKNVGMTSFDDITKAMMYNQLTRGQLAKFAVKYATDVLGMKPDMTRSDMCFWYSDTAKSADLIQYIQYACMMKLLGQKSDGITPAPKFRPNDFVTRAEFGTFMSRLVFGDTYNSKTANDPKWYQAHLEALKEHGIITQIDMPLKLELRARALVIMYRTAEFLAKQ